MVGHDELKRVVDEWLTEHDIPHYVPPALASEQYADASHPTADGYAALARGLVAQPSFAEFYGR
jgi:lysophospholipase L1-like esterase